MTQKSRIAVAGATGRLGGHIVSLLTEQGHEVVPISRSHGVDVATGEGLDAALAGVDTIIDAATQASSEQEAATAFFRASAANLHAAGERAGVQRLVVVSIIGIDDFTGGYQAAKIAHEQAALAGPLPVRIVRAAQFHEFVEQLVGWTIQGDVAYVPAMRTQLVAARTAADVTVRIALAADVPAQRIPEVAGPREERLADVARLLLERRGSSVRVVEVAPENPDDALLAGGALLPRPHAVLDGPTFEQWLAAEEPAVAGNAVL